MMMKVSLSLALVAMLAMPALAQDGATVSQLIKDGYEVKGVIPSSAGPGILLQKDGDLVMCFVAETTDSAEITTQYCKPVR